MLRPLEDSYVKLNAQMKETESALGEKEGAQGNVKEKRQLVNELRVSACIIKKKKKKTFIILAVLRRSL